MLHGFWPFSPVSSSELWKKEDKKTVALDSSILESKVWNDQTASDPNSWSGEEELVGDGRLLTKMFQVLNRWLPVQENLPQLTSRRRHFWRVAILMKSRSLPPKTKRNIKMFPVRAVGVNSLLKEREEKKKKERERERKRGKKNEKPVIERLYPGLQKLWHYFIAVQFSLDLLSKESFRAPKKCRVKSCFECGQSAGNHWQRVTGNICRGNDETTHDSSAGSRKQPRVRPLSEVAFSRNAQKTGVDRLYPGIQNLKRGVAHLAAAGLFLFFADVFVLFNRITT